MPPPSNAAAAKRALPPKESSLFRELLTLYETKQLKKGVKTADQILKKFPDHGGMSYYPRKLDPRRLLQL
jgi:N-alpha-acetyltransferase 15/16, NatA auxiliary subunit